MRMGLTEAGWALLVLAVLMLSVGFYAELNLLYLLSSTLIALVAFSIPLAAMSVTKLDIERRLPEEIFAETPFSTEIRLVRTGRARLRPGRVSLEETYIGPGGRRRFYCFFDRLPRRGALRGSYAATLPRRGAWKTARPWLVSTFPFGLAYARARLDHTDELTVFPRLGHLVRTPAAPGRPGAIRRRQVVRREQDGEFRSLREYQPGDNPHLISWRISAKRGKLQLRELELPSGSERVTLILDMARRKGADEEARVEHAVSFAATLALHFRRLGRAVTFLSASGMTPLTHQRRAILRHLALEPTTEDSSELVHAVEEASRDHALAPAVIIAGDRATAATLLERLPSSGVHSYVTREGEMEKVFELAKVTP